MPLLWKENWGFGLFLVERVGLIQGAEFTNAGGDLLGISFPHPQGRTKMAKLLLDGPHHSQGAPLVRHGLLKISWS